MEILHVIQMFPPVKGRGGPPRSVHNLAKAQVGLGHDVTVYTTDMKGPDERFSPSNRRTTMDGIKVRRFRNLSHQLAWNDVPVPYNMSRVLNAHVNKYDVVHAHACRTIDAEFARRYTTKHGVPYVMQPRGSIPRLTKRRVKQLFDILFGRRVFENADRIVASSRVESNQYNDIFPGIDDEQVAHVPNGVDIDEYTSDIETGGFRDRLNVGDAPLILFLSRLHERKGADWLIEAVHSLRAEFPDARLAIVGPDDGYQKTLKAMVDQRGLGDAVFFPGPLYGEEKLVAYDDADVFVLPSKNRYESFGNVVVEAMARETAVVATNVCGVTEWVSDKACMIVDPDIEAIEDGIGSLLRDDEYRATVAKNGREEIEDLRWESVAQQMDEVYEEVVV